MVSALGSVNWIAVLLAVVVYTVLGGVWFAGLFAKLYAAALGRESTPKPTRPPLFSAVRPSQRLFVVMTTAALMSALGIEAVIDAVVFALVVGIGYLVAKHRHQHRHRGQPVLPGHDDVRSGGEPRPGRVRADRAPCARRRDRTVLRWHRALGRKEVD